ncbi:MAG TPA: radical SAM protein, partial [Chromatiaceae bacterium]|nr:radical SAM protein [Chromatiaceae bacterium]
FKIISHIAKKRSYRYVRLSGGEPTISKSHILELIKYFEEEGLTFILETNGILIGHDPTYAKELANYTNIIVRVSFKGTTKDEFHILTGALPEFYELQFRALENLINAGLSAGKDVYPAAMIGFSSNTNIANFVRKLIEIDKRFMDVDWEYVFLYPHVEERLKKLGLNPLRAVKPDKIPRSMI